MCLAFREQPIFTTKAHVFQIDPNTKKKWIPSSTQAVNVSFYCDSTRNTYRIISVEGSKAVINSTITPNMTFTKTSVKFGQWSDARANTVYGLGFSSEAELTKFVEKFKEVKELTRQVANKTSATSAAITNGTPTHEVNHVINENISTRSCNSPVGSPKTVAINAVNDSLTAERNSPALSTPGLPDQLKYENDRLKIALAQSSANAKKWEIELQTLKNNNARLTTALQESTTNVEEWKRQLALYKEENVRLKKKVLECEKSGGASELLHRQLADLREKVSELERANTGKQEEIARLTKELEEMKATDMQKQDLVDRVKMLERDKEALSKDNLQLKERVETASRSSTQEKDQLIRIQEQIGSKVSELYGLSDKLADMLQH
ncbi:hypothetical protein LSH36_363g01032 [Paralvinella palmiformis]|uniref:WH1 domain-containing protein n=1 Tax=Paralvinella palmiformis TaxID=53620 RepID=A0AAD9JF26_9ANNE|nr:hypothetical protein LSH36_363g01032 [Paralvinella palmiformis]